MTLQHPIITACERTGYPPRDFSPSELHPGYGECESCGEIAEYGNYCKECYPTVCAICDCSGAASDTHSGVCEDCLESYATDEKYSLPYLSDCEDAFDGKGESPCEAVGASAGYEIRRNFQDEFLAAELTAIVKARLLTSAAGADWLGWTMPLFATLEYKAAKVALDKALKEFCLEDSSHFAEWLRKRVGA